MNKIIKRNLKIVYSYAKKTKCKFRPGTFSFKTLVFTNTSFSITTSYIQFEEPYHYNIQLLMLYDKYRIFFKKYG
jgi:hypothetical protein